MLRLEKTTKKSENNEKVLTMKDLLKPENNTVMVKNSSDNHSDYSYINVLGRFSWVFLSGETYHHFLVFGSPHWTLSNIFIYFL